MRHRFFQNQREADGAFDHDFPWIAILFERDDRSEARWRIRSRTDGGCFESVSSAAGISGEFSNISFGQRVSLTGGGSLRARRATQIKSTIVLRDFCGAGHSSQDRAHSRSVAEVEEVRRQLRGTKCADQPCRRKLGGREPEGGHRFGLRSQCGRFLNFVKIRRCLPEFVSSGPLDGKRIVSFQWNSFWNCGSCVGK